MDTGWISEYSFSYEDDNDHFRNFFENQNIFREYYSDEAINKAYSSLKQDLRSIKNIYNGGLSELIGKSSYRHHFPVGTPLEPEAFLAGKWLHYTTGLKTGLFYAIDDNIVDILVNLSCFAETNYHPFQAGPTHQGTQHSIQVMNCVNHIFTQTELLTKYATKGQTFVILYGCALYLAAMFHDIGKANLIKTKDHGKLAANIIRNSGSDIRKIEEKFWERKITSSNLGSEIKMYNLVAKIIENHDKLVDISKIDHSIVCSHFRLADTMDMNFKRVSLPILGISKESIAKTRNIRKYVAILARMIIEEVSIVSRDKTQIDLKIMDKAELKRQLDKSRGSRSSKTHETFRKLMLAALYNTLHVENLKLNYSSSPSSYIDFFYFVHPNKGKIVPPYHYHRRNFDSLVKFPNCSSSQEIDITKLEYSNIGEVLGDYCPTRFGTKGEHEILPGVNLPFFR